MIFKYFPPFCVFFSSMDPTFVVESKNSLSNPKLQGFSPLFSSKSYIVIHFTFSSMIHF